MAKGRVMNKRTTYLFARPDGNSRASLPIETGTYGGTNPLARDALREAVMGKMVGTRTGVTGEGAA